MSKKNYSRPVEPVMNEAVEEPIVVETVMPEPEVKPVVKGVVIECDMLNVRKAPNTSASIVTTIKRGEEVTIDENKPKSQFYKVMLASGVEGYCMKKYIEIDK